MNVIQVVGVTLLASSCVLGPVVGRLLARVAQLEDEVAAWHQAWLERETDVLAERLRALDADAP